MSYAKIALACLVCLITAACQKVGPTATVAPPKDNPSLIVIVSPSKPIDKQPKYLSKLILDQGPCPKRDSESYGLLADSKQLNGKIECYYD